MTDREFLVGLEKALKEAIIQLEDSPKSFYDWAKEQFKEIVEYNKQKEMKKC